MRQSIKGLIFPLNSSSSANSKQPPAGQQHPWQAPSKSAWTGQQHNPLCRSDNIPPYLMCFWSGQLQELQQKGSFNKRTCNNFNPVHILQVCNQHYYPWCEAKQHSKMGHHNSCHLPPHRRHTRTPCSAQCIANCRPPTQPPTGSPHLCTRPPARMLSADTAKDGLPTGVNDILCA